MAKPAERTALTVVRASGAVVALLAVVLLAVMPAAPVRENVPGFVGAVVGFELASEPGHVLGILGAPGDPARAEAVRRMDRGNRIDYAFMIAYPALYVGIAMLLAARDAAPRWLVPAVAGLAVAMLLGDALENRELLILSGLTDPAAMTGPLARLRVCTAAKWAALFVASGLLAVPMVRAGGGARVGGLLFGAAAALGAASLVRLPALEWGSIALAAAWLWTWGASLRPAAAG